MKTRKLGNLGVSSIGLGCMGMTHAYDAPADTNEMIGVIRKAIELGCTFFDTAEVYTGENADGSTAYNEELVGEALGLYRNKIVLATTNRPRLLVQGAGLDTSKQHCTNRLRRVDKKIMPANHNEQSL